jgi:hypothetical protein
MAYWLDSAREQLQWQLIYAGESTYTALCVFADCFYLFDERSVPTLRTETTKADATTNAQSFGVLFQTGTVKGEPIFAEAGDAG